MINTPVIHTKRERITMLYCHRQLLLLFCFFSSNLCYFFFTMISDRIFIANNREYIRVVKPICMANL